LTIDKTREGFAAAVAIDNIEHESTAVSGVVMLATCGISRIFGWLQNG